MWREKKTLLMTVPGDNGQNASQVPYSVFDADLMPLNTGHFGLTILRASSFAKMQKPWFIGKPDSQGSWNTDKIDEDCVFWLQWKQAGNTLMSANKVVVGHLQLLVTWPDKQMSPLHQNISDYNKTGKPEGAA